MTKNVYEYYTNECRTKIYIQKTKKGGEKMSKSQKLDEILPLRLNKELKEKLEEIAEKKERSVSGQIRAILKDYIERLDV